MITFSDHFETGRTAVRASQPALLAVTRIISDARDGMVAQWADWLGDRITAAPTIPRATVERQFRLIIDTLAEMVGPLRREARLVWFHVSEHYGRVAAARGLAAGEVVEELHEYDPVEVARHLDGLEAELAAISQPQPDRR
jgi:hypothetical protein